MTFKTVTRNYIRNSSRRAFTLVELLVVIAIISILVGLLMPAVMNAQNEARRAQCQENLRNVAMALVNFESSKNYFPGYINTFRGQTSTWYTMILEQLGAGDLYKTIATGGSLSETPHLSVLNCPSDSRIKCRQSYRINGGLEGAVGSDKKWRSTGLSFDLKTAKDKKIESDLRVGLSQIVDGAANTILVGENANNRSDWRTAQGQFQNCIMYTTDTDWGSKQYIINRSMDSTENSIKVARPSSRHRGVALVAFADTHVISLKDSIQYNTYKMIMCPNDKGASSLGANIDINQVDNNYP
ncbi:MAG: DUF1559 domain-containing protein [Thermoguttaceae bacterium]|nr:DUF1559 domain-containing protein [Thermoguttaceae bacterium]MBQ6616191.1 DUF1559 domain-containing protein [Thermoguttaceae bacterium]